MATPQESITTVNGRRCTRSRARTLVPSIVTSEAPAVVTPTEVTVSTPIEQAPQVQSSAAEAAPPPPPPPSSSAAAPAAPPISSAPAEQPVAAPTPTQVVVSSAAGTQSAVSPQSPAPERPPEFVAIAPSGPRAAAPNGPVDQPSSPVAGLSQAAVIATDAPPAPAPTNSDTTLIAVLPPSTDRSTRQAPLFTVSAPAPGVAESAILRSSIAADPEQSSRVDSPSEPTSSNTPLAAPAQPTTTPAPALPSGDSTSGVIGPEPGNLDGSGLTIPSSGDANIGSIVGGVIGGVAGLALVCALLFYCLRKRKPKQPRWVEKKAQGPRLIEKARGIPAGVSIIFAKIKGMRAGPARNPYRRHSQQDSISSIYSTNPNGRDGFFAAEVPVRRSSSRKSERNRLRKKNSSVSSQSAFVDIQEDRENPFNDPEPPRVLHLSNPDANQSPRGPLTPQPAVTQANPFDTPFDDPAVPPGWPGAMPPALGHKRTQSSASALSSHPPSLMLAGPGTMTKGPSGSPPAKETVAPARRSSMAYPTFDATSTGDSRISDLTFYSDPPPSRPGTNLFTPGLRTGRTVRQSDPFDLDRPEVLGFGNVVGRREVRSSVVRQGTRGRRASSAANQQSWASTNEGPYQPYSAAGRR